MDDETLERFYRERLEEKIILHLSEIKKIPLKTAMNIYYHSKLADMIYFGTEGIQYLDYKVLVQILCDTEKALFSQLIE